MVAFVSSFFFFKSRRKVRSFARWRVSSHPRTHEVTREHERERERDRTIDGERGWLVGRLVSWLGSLF